MFNKKLKQLIRYKVFNSVLFSMRYKGVEGDRMTEGGIRPEFFY